MNVETHALCALSDGRHTKNEKYSLGDGFSQMNIAFADRMGFADDIVSVTEFSKLADDVAH